jgi:OFA family oxalate/formate antiporter-like MFS transporter
MKQILNNRWLIALAGTMLQMLLGTVYAWSYFQNPLKESFGWSDAQVMWAFSLAICFLGLAAAWGGINLPRFGPRRLAISGGLLFGLGYLLAAMAFHWHSLPLLYVGYGVVGGIGLGLGYVTPVATVAKWFPDKKGLATGMVIMGFGFGALLMSKVIAPRLMELADGDFVKVFAWMGVGFGSLSVAAAVFLRNPPAADLSKANSASTPNTSILDNLRAVLRWRFVILWLIFFCNILAGISIVSFQSPLIQELWKKIDPRLSAETSAAYGATLIAVSSLFNGVGRMFWGGLSDHIGRAWTFRIMLATQIVAFLLLSRVGNPWVFGALICYVLLCYGGGFGTMPAFVLDVFGGRLMPVAYGAILTAWSAGGVVGPLMIAVLKDHCPAKAANFAFWISAAVLTTGLVLATLWRETKSGDLP